LSVGDDEGWLVGRRDGIAERAWVGLLGEGEAEGIDDGK